VCQAGICTAYNNSSVLKNRRSGSAGTLDEPIADIKLRHLIGGHAMAWRKIPPVFTALPILSMQGADMKFFQ
jgi:hypothetical protein